MRSTKLFPRPALQKHDEMGIITPWCNESCCAEWCSHSYRAVGCWRTSRPADVYKRQTYMYQQTGKWPLIWRLDKQKGTVAIRCALDALNRSAHANIQSLTEATGHHICLELQHRNYIDVKRFYPLSAYTIALDDIRIGTEGGWRKGDPNWLHALLLACLLYTSTYPYSTLSGSSSFIAPIQIDAAENALHKQAAPNGNREVPSKTPSQI